MDLSACLHAPRSHIFHPEATLERETEVGRHPKEQGFFVFFVFLQIIVSDYALNWTELKNIFPLIL